MGAALAIALTFSASAEDKAPKSGLQVGQKAKAFNPLHCNGKQAGTKNCLV
jgi:hypothetical protein